MITGDDDQSLGHPATVHAAPSIIRVRADAHADVLFRIAAQLNLLNCSPIRFVLEQGAEDDVLVEVHIAGCTDTSIGLMCRKIERLTCVYEVAREDTVAESGVYVPDVTENPPHASSTEHMQ